MGRFSPTVVADYGPGLNIGNLLSGYQEGKARAQGDQQQKIAEALQALQLQHAGIHQGQAPQTPAPIQFSAKPGAFDPTSGTFLPSTVSGPAQGMSPMQSAPDTHQLGNSGYYQNEGEADAYTAKEQQASLVQKLLEYQGKAQADAEAYKGRESYKYDLGAHDRGVAQTHQLDEEIQQAARDAEIARHNRATEGLIGRRETRVENKTTALPVTARKYWADAILAQYGGDPATAMSSPEAQEKGLGMADFSGSAQRATDAKGRAVFGQSGRMLSSFADTSATHAVDQATNLYNATHKHVPLGTPTTSSTGVAAPTTADDILKHYKLTPKK